MQSLFQDLEPRRLFTATFTVATPAAGVGDAEGIATGDFNGDGKLDLVTTGRQTVNGEQTARYGLAVYLGNGDGTFQSPEFIVTNGRPYQVLAFDANGDGKTDLITSDATSSDLVVLTGNGDGTFASTALLSSYFSSGASSSSYQLSFIDSADFNKDGKTDVVVSFTPDNGVNSYLAFMYQTTGGAFVADHLIAIGGPGPVVAGDFNGDGNADVAYDVGSAKQVFLRTDISANSSTFQAYDLPGAPRVLFKGDFNGDGKLDLGVPNNGNTISLFLNGNFGNRIDVAATAPDNAVAADFDGDTQADIVTFRTSANTASVLTSTGGAAYASPVDLDLSGSAGYASTTGDFNNDGKTDVAYAFFNQNLALQGGVGVLLNNSVTVPPVSPPPPPPPSGGGGSIPDGTVFVLGAKNKKPLKETITYTNNTSNTQTGSATAFLALSTNQTYETGTDTVVFTSTKKANLKPGKPLKVNASLQTISNVPAGNYYLLSVVTDPTGATTVLSSSATVSVQAATVNLTGSFSKQPVAYTVGKKNSITVAVTNNGNTTFKGALPIELFASADQTVGSDIDLGSTSKNVNLAPGKTVKVTYSFTPSTPSSVTPAYLLVRLDPNNTTSDPNTADNYLFSSAQIPFA